MAKGPFARRHLSRTLSGHRIGTASNPTVRLLFLAWDSSSFVYVQGKLKRLWAPSSFEPRSRNRRLKLPPGATCTPAEPASPAYPPHSSAVMSSPHPYASRSSRPPTSTYQTGRRRSSSLGLHRPLPSPSPHPPPSSSPPRIPLPDPPDLEDDEDQDATFTQGDDWFHALQNQSDQTQPQAPTHRPSPSASSSSAHPRLAPAPSSSTLSTTISNTNSSSPPSRPSSRLSTTTPDSHSHGHNLMRRLSSVANPSRRSRSKSRSRAASASDAEAPADLPTPRPPSRQKANTHTNTTTTTGRSTDRERNHSASAPARPNRALLQFFSSKSSHTHHPHQQQQQQQQQHQPPSPPQQPTLPPTLPHIPIQCTTSDEWVHLNNASTSAARSVGRRKTTTSSAANLVAAATAVVDDSAGARSRSNSYPRGPPAQPQPHLYIPPLLPLPPSPLPTSLHNGTPSAPYHIAVVGPRGSGKSTVVGRGLKEWGSGEVEVVYSDENPGEVLYTSRPTTIPHTSPSGSISIAYRILELSTDAPGLDWLPPFVWPEWMPYVDGVLLCYDSSVRDGSRGLLDWVACISELSLPTVILATKSDLPEAVPTARIDQRVRAFGVGVVAVTREDHRGKVGMRHCFRWMCKVVTGENRDERLSYSMSPIFSTPTASTPTPQLHPSRPATPRTTSAAPRSASSASASATSRPPTPTRPPDPHEDERAFSPSASDRFSPTPTPTPLPGARPPDHPPPPPTPSPPRPARGRARSLSNVQPLGAGFGLAASMSTGNLMDLGRLEAEQRRERERETEEAGEETEEDEEMRDHEPSAKKQPSWMFTTLEDLCYRVFFDVISDREPAFLYHFFLTYRKFTTTRFVLREWQKFWDRLDAVEKDDATVRNWAKMRMGHLLCDWVTNFPQDFARIPDKVLVAPWRTLYTERLTMLHATSLRKLLKQAKKMHPNGEDADFGWSMQDAVEEDEEAFYDVPEAPALPVRTATTPRKLGMPTSASMGAGTTRGSAYTVSASHSSDLSTLAGSSRSGSSVKKKASSRLDHGYGRGNQDEKSIIRDFARTADQVEKLPAAAVAREITRLEIPLFLGIEPREWARHLWLPQKQRPYPDPIDCMAVHFMRVQTWVTCLILSQEGGTKRQRIIAFLVQVAHELRRLSNFNSLRAVHVGIKGALPNTPNVLHTYINSPRIWHIFDYHEVLFNSQRNYLVYHRTLSHTPWFAIPNLEIHTSYLLRSEVNKDWHPNQPELVHWGKFAVFGKTIDAVTKFQERQPPALTDTQYKDKFFELFVRQPLLPAAIIERRRAPEHFADRTPFQKAKGLFGMPTSPPAVLNMYHA